MNVILVHYNVNRYMATVLLDGAVLAKVTQESFGFGKREKKRERIIRREIREK